MKLLLPTACLLAAVGLVSAADWPQWRGPDRTNVSRETGLLTSWPKDGPKLLWTFDQAGRGYSGPAIVGERLYLLGSEGEQDVLLCLDVKTGRKQWSSPLGPVFKQDRGNGPRSTPTVDGERVYALDGQGNLACFDAKGGKRIWMRNLTSDLGGRMMSGWGYSESPLVDGDHLVCTPGGAKGTVAALDKNTGETVWRSKDWTDPAGYASLVVSEAGGVRQYVQMTGQHVAGVAARDGAVLWKFARTSRTAAIPTPIAFGDHVYVTSGYGAGCALLKLTASPDGKFKAEEVYANKNMTNHHGGVVLLGGYIYGYSDGKGWMCQDALKGDIVWPKTRNQAAKLGKGSLTCAGGMLYCFSEDTATAVLAEAAPKGWQEHGRFTIPQTSKLPRPSRQRARNFWTHPVVANGRLYLRDTEFLFCYDVSKNGR